MVKIVTGVIIEESNALTLEEICRAIQSQKDFILQLIDYQLIQPQGASPDDWRFDSESLKRARLARSFYHDLEVNLPGVALALELLDKIEHLQHQLDILEKK